MARGDPPASLEYLRSYYRGVFFAIAALKGRFESRGSELSPAAEEVTRYQAMVKRFMDALEQTTKMHAERQ
jgi:hypothetical protein